MAGPWEKYATSESSKPWEKYSADKKEMPDKIGSLSEGARLRLGKQLIGAQEIGSDIARALSGEMGQPYSPYRKMVQSRGQELMRQTEQAPPLTRAGDIGMMVLESVAIPYGASSTAGRVSLNALLGGGMAGLQPYETPLERAQATATGAFTGAMIPEVAGPLTGGLSNMAKYGRGIVNPQYGAIREIARETKGATLPTELTSAYGNAPPPGQAGPVLPPFGRVPGLKPTVGMITDNPALLELEQNARLRAAPDFMSRDIENQQAIIDELERRAITPEKEAQEMEALNRLTGAKREQAFTKAGEAPLEMMVNPLRESIESIRTRPGTRGSESAQVLAGKTERSSFGKGEGFEGGPTPEDLYTARKQIDDALKGYGGANDTLTNAVKGNKRVAMELKSAIDEGLNAASEGDWSKYLSTYVEKIKPIEEGRAFRDVTEMFRNAPVIPGTTIRSITPAKMRKAASDVTTKEMGTMEIDRLSPEGRAFLDDAAMAMSALENAQKGARATTGSPTAGYLTGLMKSGLVPQGGKISSLVNLMDAMGRSRGAIELDEALRDPEKFQQLLNAYHAGQASPGLSGMLERTAPMVPEYIRKRFR